MNELMTKQFGESTELTPIEIMLGVDEKGETTARKLYDFLQLDKKNYSRWIKSKITENEFATENIDFKVLVIDEENPLGGRPTQDFALSASFAKKLAMGTPNERGEQAKNYFIKVEDVLKSKNNQLNSNQSQQVMFLAQNIQQMAVTMAEFMTISTNQLQSIKEETKIEVKEIVRNSIVAKDQQIEQTAEMIGIRDKNTKSLTNHLKEKLSDHYGRKIMASSNVYKNAQKKVFEEFDIFKWEDISAGNFLKVFSYIDSIEDFLG